MTRILSVFRLLKRVGFAVLFCVQFIAHAQPPDTMWTRVYPGTGNPWSFEQTLDGGFIVASSANTPPNTVLTRIDSAGNLQWSRHYPTDNRNFIFDVKQLSDGGFVGVGRRSGFPHHFDYATYAIRTMANGDTLWTREYNLDERNDQLISLVAVDDGLLCVGLANYVGSSVDFGDVLIMKISFAGDTLWTRRCGTAFPDFAYDIIQLAEDRYLVAGIAGDPASLDQLPTQAFALMINSEGDSLWMHTYSNDTYVECFDAEPDGESGFLLTGFVEGNLNESRDVYAMRGDSVGNLLWQNRIGGNLIEIGYEIRHDSRGGSVVFGSQGPTSQGKYFTVRLANNGDTLWTALYGNPWDYAGLGGIILSNESYMMMGVQIAPDSVPSGLMLIRTFPEGLDATDPVPAPSKIAALSAYPNPFNATTTIQYELPATSLIKLTVYDMLGRQVQALAYGQQSIGVRRVQLDSDGLASGTYFVRFETDKEEHILKIILEK